MVSFAIAELFLTEVKLVKSWTALKPRYYFHMPSMVTV